MADASSMQMAGLMRQFIEFIKTPIAQAVLGVTVGPNSFLTPPAVLQAPFISRGVASTTTNNVAPPAPPLNAPSVVGGMHNTTRPAVASVTCSSSGTPITPPVMVLVTMDPTQHNSTPPTIEEMKKEIF